MSSRYVSEYLLEKAIGSQAKTVIHNIKELNNHKDENDNNNDKNEINQIPELRHWRDLGSYLDTLHTKPFENLDNDLNNNKNNNVISAKPLSQPVSYRICNSCGTGILEKEMIGHLKLCTNNSNIINNNINKNGDEKIKSDDKLKNEPIIINEESDDKIKNNNNNKNSPVKKDISKEKIKKNTKQTKKVTKKRKSDSNEDNNNNNNSNNNSNDNVINKENNDTNEPATKKTKIERKKKEPKQKIGKNKGPVDVERQCGVPLPNGGFCARSLTCKTHSMGAKRSVLGRSAPYDQLLAAYQRKNQAKIGAAAAAAQQAKDDLMHGAGVALDDEEETQQVLAGVRRSYAVPLERNVCIPVRMRTGYLRMRELFASSLLPRLQNNPLGKLYARAAVMNVENIGEAPFFPVRSQHQKNNQQRQNMKQNSNLMQIQMQKQAQIQAQLQAKMQTQINAQTQNNKQNPNIVPVQHHLNNGIIPNDNMNLMSNNHINNNLNISTLTPQQQQQQQQQKMLAMSQNLMQSDPK